MKTYRSRFEENFKAVPEASTNRRGIKIRYVYIGLWYVWNVPRERARAMKWLVGGGCALSILLFLAGGLVHSPLNYARYVQLPGMLSMAALVFEGFGSAQFCLAEERMNCMDFRDIRGKLLIAPLLHGLLLLCAAAAAAWEMASKGFVLTDVFVLLCYICSALVSLAMFWQVRALPYRTEKNEDALIGLDDED